MKLGCSRDLATIAHINLIYVLWWGDLKAATHQIVQTIFSSELVGIWWLAWTLRGRRRARGGGG